MVRFTVHQVHQDHQEPPGVLAQAAHLEALVQPGHMVPVGLLARQVARVAPGLMEHLVQGGVQEVMERQEQVVHRPPLEHLGLRQLPEPPVPVDQAEHTVPLVTQGLRAPLAVAVLRESPVALAHLGALAPAEHTLVHPGHPAQAGQVGHPVQQEHTGHLVLPAHPGVPGHMGHLAPQVVRVRMVHLGHLARQEPVAQFQGHQEQVAPAVRPDHQEPPALFQELLEVRERLEVQELMGLLVCLAPLGHLAPLVVRVHMVHLVVAEPLVQPALMAAAVVRGHRAVRVHMAVPDQVGRVALHLLPEHPDRQQLLVRLALQERVVLLVLLVQVAHREQVVRPEHPQRQEHRDHQVRLGVLAHLAQ